MENNVSQKEFASKADDAIVWMACSFTEFHQCMGIIDSLQSCFLIPRVKRVILSIYANVKRDPEFPTLHDPANWPALDSNLLDIPEGKILTVCKRDKAMDSFSHYRLIIKVLAGVLHPNTWITLCEPGHLFLSGLNECYDLYPSTFLVSAYVTLDKSGLSMVPWIKKINPKNVNKLVEDHKDEMLTDIPSETGISMRFHIISDFLNNYELNPKAKLFGNLGMTLLNTRALEAHLKSKGAELINDPVVLIVHGLSRSGEDFSGLLEKMVGVAGTIHDNLSRK